MEKNKFKIENQCLTGEQSKDLFDIGVNVYGEFGIFETESHDKFVSPVNLSTTKDYTPILTNAEMIGMLPETIKCAWENDPMTLSVVYKNGSCVVKYDNQTKGLEFFSPLLRDSLYSCIGFLKVNKLM